MFCASFSMQYLVSILVLQSFRKGRESWLLSTCSHATVSVPCLFLTVWLIGLQYVIVVFSGLLGLRIALSIAACPMLYLTHREQNSL